MLLFDELKLVAAQDTATIVGTVTDSSGAVLPGVEVLAHLGWPALGPRREP